MGDPIKNPKVYIGTDSGGEHYIHIYRKGIWPTESIRVHLHKDNNVSISRSSAKVWREWAEIQKLGSKEVE